MVKVIYDRNQPSVTMEGHAGSGTAGHDLVCASLSILAYTLASSLELLDDEEQRCNVHVELKEGEGLISCDPDENCCRTVTIIFETICTGFDLLAQNYPNHVFFEITGG